MEICLIDTVYGTEVGRPRRPRSGDFLGSVRSGLRAVDKECVGRIGFLIVPIEPGALLVEYVTLFRPLIASAAAYATHVFFSDFFFFFKTLYHRVSDVRVCAWRVLHCNAL